MTTFYFFLGAALVTVAVVALAIREARRGGRAEERAQEATHAVENAEHVATAVADAPRTAGELDDRVQSGTWKL